MVDLEGALLSLRSDHDVAMGRFIDDNARLERVVRSILVINNILSRPSLEGSENQLQGLQSASAKLAAVQSNQNAKFDSAMNVAENALSAI